MRADLRRGLLGAVVAATFAVSGCTEIERAMSSVDVLNFMHESPSLDPYEAPRNAPPLSVPVASPAGKWEPPVEATEASLRAWGDTMMNPLAMEEDVLLNGARHYQTYCAVCHGTTAAGNGPIVGQGKLPFATNLLLPATQQRSDGYIYAVIRLGRGLMPSYQRITPRERWAVVNYVRYLQQGNQPLQVDLPGNIQPGYDQFNTAPPQDAGTAGADPDTAGRE